MGLEFIDRSLRSTGIVLLVFLPFGVYYIGLYPTLAIFSGCIWSLFNLIFISAMVRATIRPEGANKMKTIGLALFKFPVLYLSGYFLLKIQIFEPHFLVIGFTGLFGIIVLRAVGRLISNVDDHTTKSIQEVK